MVLSHSLTSMEFATCGDCSHCLSSLEMLGLEVWGLVVLGFRMYGFRGLGSRCRAEYLGLKI